jgi:DNA-3-methyladenine glycosylase II
MAKSIVAAVKEKKMIEEIAPDYWEQASCELMKQDRILKKLIPKFGSGFLVTRGDAFNTLARSIVGQQISVAAAQSVWNKVVLASKNKVSPKNILALTVEELRAAGLSGRKVEYIRDLADHFHSGRLHASQWKDMEDEDVIKELSGIRGIGRWTAEMFLIFNLVRPNILPLDDVGLIKAISLNYFSGEPVSRHEAREVAANWAPWRTVATWYMWRSIDPIPVEY